MNLNAFDHAYTLFQADEIPFLHQAKARLRDARPYKGLKILHNVPLTLESLHKVHALLLGGAEVTVSSPSFMEPKGDAVDVLRAAGVPVFLDGEPPKDVDIMLDCAGELLDRVRPRIGAVELTGTGTQRYAAKPCLTYPVISVDQSSVKNLEALLGTGDGFVRAFEELTGEPVDGRSVVIFGFGKVGQGIAHALASRTGGITVVEPDRARLDRAQTRNLLGVRAKDVRAVEAAVREAFVVVTATGRNHAISDNYAAAPFRRAEYLANMGGEDEFGPAFADTEIMVAKKPINFAIDHPTKIRYLDPVFHAHNLGIDLLLFGALTPGVHPFPAFLADEIVSSWQRCFGEDVGDCH